MRSKGLIAPLFAASLAACVTGGESRPCTGFGKLQDPFCTPVPSTIEGSSLSIFGLAGSVASTISYSGAVSGAKHTSGTVETLGPAHRKQAVGITPGPDDSMSLYLQFNPVFSLSFSKADRVDAPGGTFDVFEKGPSRLTLLNTDNGGTGFQHTTFGIWEIAHTDGFGTLLDSYSGAIAFGAATPASAMPTSGSATFTGRMDGRYATGLTPAAVVTGAAALTANFGAATYSSAFTNVTVAGQPFRDISGTGSITNNSFVGTGNLHVGGMTGTLATDPAKPGQTGPDMSGSLTGGFYGPAANEVGGTFVLSGGGATMTGGFVGRR